MSETRTDGRTDAPAIATGTDRRRPGRIDANPALIPLLRGEAAPTPDATFDGSDDLAPSRGIAFGVLLSIPAWIGIVRSGIWLLGR